MTEARSEDEVSAEAVADSQTSIVIGPAVWSQVEVPEDVASLAGRTLDDVSAAQPRLAPRHPPALAPPEPRPATAEPPPAPALLSADVAQPPMPEPRTVAPSPPDRLGVTLDRGRLPSIIAVGAVVAVALVGAVVLAWPDDTAPEVASGVLTRTASESGPVGAQGALDADGAGPETFALTTTSEDGTATTDEVASTGDRPTTSTEPPETSTTVPSSTTTGSTAPSTTVETSTTSSSTTTTASSTTTASTTTTAVTTTDPTVSSTLGSTTESTTPVEEAPSIVSFTTGPAPPDTPCDEPDLEPVEASWSTERASSVELRSTEDSYDVAPTGSKVLCAPPGSALTLTAEGPGGEDSSTINL